MNIIAATTTLALFSSVLVGAASATTMCSGALSSDGMTQCTEYFVGAGNPAGGTPSDPEDLFGDGSDWFELGTQLEASSTTDTIDYGAFEAVFTLDGAFGSATSGDWAVNFWPASAAEIAFVLKAGNAYAAYLMDQDPFSLEGDWTTALLTNPQGSPQGISNISVFAKAGGNTPPPPFEAPTPTIPLPAGAWLLLGGLGGLAGLRRKRG